MKSKIIAIFIILEMILMLSLNLTSSALTNDENEIITFKDENLKNGLLEYDENNDGELSITEMENIKKLYLQDSNIIDLTGLEYATNLQVLNLFSNNISDIRALSNLTNLTDLSLYKNNISDISALANLKNLTDLNLGINSINDINALSNLTNLTDLNLSHNNISDISALANLINLADLNLSGNSIGDIGVLEDLNISPKRIDLLIQRLNIDLGDVEYGTVKEIELPKIFSQYSKYNPDSEMKIIANYAYLNEDNTACILDTKYTGNHNVYINIDTIKLTLTYNVTPLKGDINKDGKVSLYDAFRILRKIILEEYLTEEQEYIMDYNDDGKVSLYDAFRFLRQVILN